MTANPKTVEGNATAAATIEPAGALCVHLGMEQCR